MAKVIGAVVVDNEACKGCGLCVAACPQDVLGQNKQVNGRGYHYSFMKNPEACIGCSNCATVCPDTCITVYRVKL
jgi:Formate hydrogenlyase subunit 6/NADH:ubiquinone oxidoreductase 23 kD subunit (chain I)